MTYRPAIWQAYADTSGVEPTSSAGEAAVSWLVSSREWGALCPCGWLAFRPLRSQADAALTAAQQCSATRK